jgi:hypothetical protein
VDPARMFGMLGRECFTRGRGEEGADGSEPLENFPPLHQEEIPLDQTAT